MANEMSRYNWIMVVVVAITLLVLSFVFSSLLPQAPDTPVVTPTVPPTVPVPLLPSPSVAPIEVVPTPTPSLPTPEGVRTPTLPLADVGATSPPAVRAEVAEVKEHVAKTADDLTETIEEFRKEADELDLGE